MNYQPAPVSRVLPPTMPQAPQGLGGGHANFLNGSGPGFLQALMRQFRQGQMGQGQGPGQGRMFDRPGFGGLRGFNFDQFR